MFMCINLRFLCVVLLLIGKGVFMKFIFGINMIYGIRFKFIIVKYRKIFYIIKR